jgi:orotate phosphoribosyltransferase
MLTDLKNILVRRNSIRFGEFKLVSGATSDVYVDARLTTCAAEAMPLIGRAFLSKMRERGWSPEAVGGLTSGADPIAFAIARESLETAHVIDAFFVRKEPKPHGMQRLVEGIDPTEGRKVVVIDDVCTKGGSTAIAIRNVRLAGMQVLGAICLVDREMGARELLEGELGCPFDSVFKLSDFRTVREV